MFFFVIFFLSLKGNVSKNDKCTGVHLRIGKCTSIYKHF